MQSRMRTLLVGFLLLWLPLQGFAAAWTVSCGLQPTEGRSSSGKLGHASHPGMQHAMDHGCCQHSGMQSADHRPDPQPTGHSAHDLGLCDDCASCHLGTAFAIPVTAVSTVAASKPVFHPFRVSTPVSFIPEQPQRPPLAA
jgi:hypothetical protein